MSRPLFSSYIEVLLLGKVMDLLVLIFIEHPLKRIIICYLLQLNTRDLVYVIIKVRYLHVVQHAQNVRTFVQLGF